MKLSKLSIALTAFVVVTLTWGMATCFAGPSFYGTADTNKWLVSTNILTWGGGEGPDPVTTGYFNTSSFSPAVYRSSNNSGTDWIANAASGSNSGNWTFFVFRQTFDLSGYNPATAQLSFYWGADDSGAAWATRGRWIPEFSLNGGAFIYYPTWNGTNYTTGNESYAYQLQTISSGFIEGLNTIDFYVEGNGTTDGLQLRVESFTARPYNKVPEPATMLLLGLGLAGIAGFRKRMK